MYDSSNSLNSMPYSLNIKTHHSSQRSSREWSEDDRIENSGTPRRRLSLNSSGDFRPLHPGDFRGPSTPIGGGGGLHDDFQIPGAGGGGGGGGSASHMVYSSPISSLNNSSLSPLRMEWQARQGELKSAEVAGYGLDHHHHHHTICGEATDCNGDHHLYQPEAEVNTERLLVVANRLPVCARRETDGTWQLDLSDGGLVSALLGVKKNFETVWIGWPGIHVPDEWGRKTLTEALGEKGCVPVFLDEETVDQYYNGYCNNVLWPLFHYIGVTYPMEDKLSSTRSPHTGTQWGAYQHANRQFASIVLKEYQDGDIVWCHDYHLMLLPSLLKEKKERMKVGWFLHTPFPSSEIYRTLPLRREILTGVLSADLIGFHTYDYARHFVSSCSRILGHEGTPDGVENCQTGAMTRVAAFPIGIDPIRFIKAVEHEDVKSYIAELRARFAGKKVMLGVDRLDMIKGIPQKLLAFEKFLEEHPDWRDKVILVQIAVPSRTDVPEYQRFSSQVHEIVGRINGRFGTVLNMPIHHLTRSIEFNQLVALYAVTDVALVTSLRDGMNLVSYEFVACQNAKKGVLILSEFAGAAQSLGAGAILVNPWNVSDVASAIEEALTMPEADRVEMHRQNFKHVTVHTAQAWAETFVSELKYTVQETEIRLNRIPPQLPLQRVVERYTESNNRLLVLGFNSTLTRPVEETGRRGPDQIKEMKPTLHPLAREHLQVLCQDPATTVLILSGSEKKALDKAFGGLDLWLSAGNGMFLRHATNDKWITTMPELAEGADLRESVQPVFDYFSKRTPGSYLESRETSLVWNYKYADVEFGRVQARDLLQHLWTGSMSSAPFEIVQGTRSIEVRPSGISKGAAIDRVLAEVVRRKGMKTQIDFVFVAGRFLNKDEDLYQFFETRDLASSEEAESSLVDHASNSMSSYINRNESSMATGVQNSDSRKPGSRRCSSLGGLRRCHSHGCGLGGGKYNPMRAAAMRGQMKLPMFCSMSPDRRAMDVLLSPPFPSSLHDSFLEGDDSGEVVSALNVAEENYFSCTVGRSKTLARHMLNSSEDVVTLLKMLADSCQTSVPGPNEQGIDGARGSEGDCRDATGVDAQTIQHFSAVSVSGSGGPGRAQQRENNLQCFSTPVGSPVGGSNFGGGVVDTTSGRPYAQLRSGMSESMETGPGGIQAHLGGAGAAKAGYGSGPGRGTESPRHHYGGISTVLSQESTLHPFGGGVSAPNSGMESPGLQYTVGENPYFSYHHFDNQFDNRQFSNQHQHEPAASFSYPSGGIKRGMNGGQLPSSTAMPKPCEPYGM